MILGCSPDSIIASKVLFIFYLFIYPKNKTSKINIDIKIQIEMCNEGFRYP